MCVSFRDLTPIQFHNQVSKSQTMKSNPLAIHRQGAAGILRCLAAECTLGACLSPAQTSTIITQMCEFILSGPQFYIEQFGDASLTWQSFLSFGKFGVCTYMVGNICIETQSLPFRLPGTSHENMPRAVTLCPRKTLHGRFKAFS